MHEYLLSDIPQISETTVNVPLYTPGNDHYYVTGDNEHKRFLEFVDGDGYFLGKMASYKKVNNVPLTGIILEEGKGIYEISDGRVALEPIDFIKEMENRTCSHENIEGSHEEDVIREGDNPFDRVQIGEAIVQYYPKCYPGDEGGRYIDIAVVTDVALFQKLGNSAVKVKEFVEDTIVKARLIYYRQFNTILRIHSLRVFTEDYTAAKNGFPLSMSLSSCVYDHSYVVQSLGNWNNNNFQAFAGAAVTHMFTGCWGPYGVVGIAYINMMCITTGVGITTQLTSASTWLIFAHELAHNLGAHHTFHLGIGRTGGLMDYGNPYYNGDIQFRPESAVEMCAGLTNAMSKSYCRAFPTVSSSCGDSLLEQFRGEQCECLDGSTNCKGCRNCKLIDPGTECSTDSFVVPSPDNNSSLITVLPTLLHSDECCSSNGRIRSSLNRCGPNNVDTCSNGFCVKLCSKYLYWSCDMEEDGCVQPCKTSSSSVECYSQWVTSTYKTAISHMPNGTWCGEQGTGRCKSGKCIYGQNEQVTGYPTSMPTSMPTHIQEYELVTAIPTTQSPTVVARIPTPFPTRRTTRRPTLGGTRFPTRFGRTRRPTVPMVNSTAIESDPPYKICHSQELNDYCDQYTRKMTCNEDPICRFRTYDKTCKASCRVQNPQLPN